jgi:hypothetical protein
VVGVVLCVALAASAGAAQASVTIGSDLANAATSDHNCDPSGPNAGCTVIQTSLPAGRQLTAPFSGLIVRWRVRDYGSGTVTLRVVRLLGSTGGVPPWTVSFLRSSAAQQGGSSGIVTFAASPPLPIAAGDTIGVTGSGDNIAGAFVGTGTGASDTIMDASNPPDGMTTMSTNINSQNIDWLYNADVVAPPTSTVSTGACPHGSTATITVTADPDPATGPKAAHYRIDGGPEHVTDTTGIPGTAKVSVPRGTHRLEFWGEDQLGQQEATHHVITAGCVTVAKLSALSETNSTFAPASASTPVRGQSARQHPRGTMFAFRLDQSATVTVKLRRASAGRRVHGTCRPATKRRRHRPRCTRYATVATLTRIGQAGRNQLPFTGRIGGKALRPGQYHAVFTARDSAGTSRPRSIAFTLVRQ